MSKHLIAAIPELVKEKVISADTAAQIIEYYRKKTQSAPNYITLILGIIGALLVGSGIVLLIAHNWDNLSTLVRTILSFIPLVSGQLLCGIALLKYRSNKTWTEGSGIFLFFAVAASMSLISQVYQVSGTQSAFLFTWVALTLPLVYLLSSSILVMLCLSAATLYACQVGYLEYHDDVPYAYLGMLALLAPYYYKLSKDNRNGNVLTVLNWLLAISLIVVLETFSASSDNYVANSFLIYLLLFSIYYLKGRIDDLAGKRLRANPFLMLGILGIVCSLLYWSFESSWRNMIYQRSTAYLFTDPKPYLMVAGGAGLIYYLWNTFRKQNNAWKEPAGYSAFVFALLLFAFRSAPSIAVFILNVWILVIGLFYVRKGTRENHFGFLNFGLTIIAALSLCRFFDDDIPFIWRGLFFVGTGAGFFIANIMMIRKRKQTPKPASHV